MKWHHSGALALMGWFLVVPHGAPNGTKTAPGPIGWSIAERFNSETECETHLHMEIGQAKGDLKSGQQKSQGSTDALTPEMAALAQRWLGARCVSSDNFSEREASPNPPDDSALHFQGQIKNVPAKLKDKLDSQGLSQPGSD